MRIIAIAIFAVLVWGGGAEAQLQLSTPQGLRGEVDCSSGTPEHHLYWDEIPEAEMVPVMYPVSQCISSEGGHICHLWAAYSGEWRPDGLEGAVIPEDGSGRTYTYYVSAQCMGLTTDCIGADHTNPVILPTTCGRRQFLSRTGAGHAIIRGMRETIKRLSTYRGR